LTSYNQNHPTSHDIIQAVQDSFYKDSQLYFEYFDKNHNTGENYLKILADFFKLKFSKKHIDGIIAVDSEALKFIKKYRSIIFGNIPTVFCGMNDIQYAGKLLNQSLYAGIIEETSILETLQLAINLHPRPLKRIIALSDKRISTQKILHTFYQVAMKLPEIEFTDIVLDHSPNKDFIKMLQIIRDQSSVFLLLSDYQDKQEHRNEFKKFLSIIKDKIKLPVYCLWKYGIGEGLIGGKIISHYQQTYTASNILKSMLQGDFRTKKLFSGKLSNIFLVDYKEAERHHLNIENIPQEAIIINHPISIFTKYKLYIYLIIFIIFSSFIVMILLFYALFRLREKNKEIEGLFQNMANRTPIMIWVASVDKLRTFFNQSWLKYLGETPAFDIVNWGKNLIHKDDFDKYYKIYNKSFDDRVEFSFEYRLKNYNGEYRWISEVAIPRFSKKNTFLGYIASCTDVHYQKRLEEQMIGVHQEIKQFAHIFAHDLQEPLRKICNYCTLLEEDHHQSFSGEARDYLSTIIHTTKYMQRLIEGLLDVYHIDSEFKRELLCFQELVDLAIHFHAKTIQEKKAVILLPKKTLKINTDKKLMVKLLKIFLDNSLNFHGLSKFPEIEVGVQEFQDRWSFYVRDKGIGFDIKDKDKIFVIFQRLHNKKDHLGTGLAICQRIINIMGGTIYVESEKHIGTTFYVHIPKFLNTQIFS